MAWHDFLEGLPDSIQKYLRSGADYVLGEGPKDDQDYTKYSANPGAVIRAVFKDRGLDPYGPLAANLTQRLSQFDPENLYRMYTTRENGNPDNPEEVGRFMFGFAQAAANPSLAAQLGFSPARTYAEAAALASRALSPDSGLNITNDLKDVVATHDDDLIMKTVTTILMSSGAAIFGDRDLKQIAGRMELIKAHFDDAKLAGTFTGSFLDYLGTVGATLIRDLFPGINLNDLAGFRDLDTRPNTPPDTVVPQGTSGQAR